MKLAFVSDAIYPYNKGGKEKRLYDITTRLSDLGHDVHIYCMKWWKTDEKDRIENGVHLHAISPYYPLYSGDKRSIKEGILFGISCLKLIKKDWDIIDVDHMPYFPIFFMNIVCVLKGKKMIATWHEVWGREYWMKYLGGIKGMIAYILEVLTMLLPDKIISVSQNTTKKFNEVAFIKRSIVTIPNGIDIALINKVKPSTMISDVIFAGRLLKHKHIDRLIEAIDMVKESNPDIKCIIIGDGPEKKTLERLSDSLRLNSNIIFLGFLEKESEIYAYMKSSKVFVSPSVREGFGLSFLEANACGIPFIMVNHQDNAAQALVDGDNGEIIDLKVKILAETIEKYITTKESKSETYKESARKYDWNRLIDHYQTFYSES